MMRPDLSEVVVQGPVSTQRNEVAEADPAASPPLLDLSELAILLDIDGTLIDLAPTPHEIVVPQGLPDTLRGLLARTSGAMALVSGRSLADIDWMFAPDQFPAVGGHGAEMRLMLDNEAVAIQAPPMEEELRRRLAAIAAIDPRILVEDKGYSLALHYRLVPHAEQAIYAEVARIRADLPSAPIDVLGGKSVCEIKQSGFTKASGVRQLMSRAPFAHRRPLFIGDDVTDESVFAILPDFGGLSFSVGRRIPGLAGCFNAPVDVRKFLADLLRDDEAAR